MINRLFTEEVGRIDDHTIPPADYTAGTYNTGWVDMSLWDKICAEVDTGTLGSSATIDFQLQQATSSGGDGEKVITGKAITQMTQAASDGNQSAMIDCNASELDVNNGFRYVRATLIVGTATSYAAARIYGADPKYAPATLHNAAQVNQVVN